MRARTGWIALAVTAVTVTGVHMWGDALPELDRLFPEHDTAVNGVGVVDGNELTLVDVRSDNPGDAPAGTHTVIVSFDVVPGSDAGICATPALVEVNGAGRTWTAAREIPGWDPWESGTLCGSDDGPGRASIGFLVTDDIAANLRVEVPSGELGGKPLWFPLPR